MTRFSRQHAAERWTAQEARRDMRAGDHAYATPDAAIRKDVGACDNGPSPTRSLTSGTLTLPWPPSGNSAVRHGNGSHYLRAEVIAYRDSVAALCFGKAGVKGKYKLHVHLSPPDARKRDADNAIKSLLDAIVKAGYVEDDSLQFMVELLVTTDEERRGCAAVRAIPA